MNSDQNPDEATQLRQLQQHALEDLCKALFTAKPLENPAIGTAPASGVLPIEDQTSHMQYRTSRMMHHKDNAIAIELPEEVAHIKNGKISIDNSINIKEALEQMGATPDEAKDARVAYLEHGARRSGLRVLVDKDAYQAIAMNMAMLAVQEPRKLAVILGMDENTLKNQLHNQNSAIFNAVMQCVDAAQFDREDVASLMKSAIEKEFYELAATLGDKSKKIKEEGAKEAAESQAIFDLNNPKHIEGVILRRIIKAPLLDQHHAPEIDISHVTPVAGACAHKFADKSQPRESFSWNGSKAIELTHAETFMKGEEGFTNGVTSVHPALERLGVLSDAVDVAFLVKDGKQQGLRILIEELAYQKMAQQFGATLVTNPEKAGEMLSYNGKKFAQALHHKNSDPYQMAMKMMQAAGYDHTSSKMLIQRAAENDLMEVAGGIKEMIQQKRKALGVRDGQRQQGG